VNTASEHTRPKSVKTQFDSLTHTAVVALLSPKSWSSSRPKFATGRKICR